ncbi:hypothetical protein BGLA2_300014 [Burkholderia gladioli]|nr:hypothetical protein BGLA2_300014 [Burkholderia gladioli]
MSELQQLIRSTSIGKQSAVKYFVSQTFFDDF